MTATLIFPTRELALKFTISWGRYTLTGHTVGAGTENVAVSLYGVDSVKRQWIDSYVKNINEYLAD